VTLNSVICLGIIKNVDNLKVSIAIFLLSVAWINSSTAHVNLLGPLGGETFVHGEIVTVSWEVEIEHDPVGWDLYFSSDSGATWQQLASLEVEQLEYQWTVPNIETELARIRIVQVNVKEDYDEISRNFRISETGVITAVADPLGSPAEFEFLINYPNPFQSVTTIDFALPHHNHVSLQIYSVHGVKVAALMDEVLSAGQYSITWDATGTKPGLYLFRVQAGTFVETRKLVKLE